MNFQRKRQLKEVNAQKYNYFLDEKQERSSRRIFVIFLIILICVFAAVFSVDVYFQKNYDYITINGLSMQPTLNPEPVYINGKSVQDGVYIKKGTDADYSDIIIVDKRDDIGKTVIKRLLGKGGDKISILRLNIDGESQYRFLRIKSGTSSVEVLNETYISGKCNNSYGESRVLGYSSWTSGVSATYDLGNFYEGQFYSTYLWNSKTNHVVTDNVYKYNIVYQGTEYNNVKFYQLGQDKIFYMGDNRAESSDARATGSEDQSKIIGKVVAVTHNSTSSKNSFFYLFNRAIGYFEVLWQEIVRIFAWKG